MVIEWKESSGAYGGRQINCEGARDKNNEETGDNTGPLIKKKDA